MNLLEELKGQMSEPLLGSIAQKVGIDSDKIQSVLGSVMPGVLALLGKKSEDAAGAESVFSAIQDSDDGVPSDINNLSSGDQDSLVTKGGELFGSLFGGANGEVGGLVDGFSKLSGASSTQTKGLLGMGLPLMMGFLKGQVGKQGLNVAGFSSLMSSQKDHLGKALPAEASSLLGLGSFLPAAGAAAATTTASGASSASVASNAASPKASGASSASPSSSSDFSGGGGIMKWLLLAALALLLFFLLKTCGGADKGEGQPSPSIGFKCLFEL